MPAQITFQSMPEAGATENDADAKRRARAEKFGIPVKPAGEAKPREPREARRGRPGRRDAMGTGFDLFSAEERGKQANRAARFGTAAPVEGIAIARLSENEAAKKNRAEKFGLDYQEPERSGIDRKFVLEGRADVDTGIAEPRDDALHVYGVDLLTTNDIMGHFHTYSPTYVEWINDSSCNVRFPDKYTVKRVLVQMGEALTEEQANEAGVLKFDDATVPQLWYRSKTAFTKSGVSVPLNFRIATTLDRKDPQRKHKQRHLWRMGIRDAFETAKQHADAGGPEAALAEEEEREEPSGCDGEAAASTRKVKGRGKRTRLDADGDVVMGGPGGQPRRKKQSGAGGGGMEDEGARGGDGGGNLLDDDMREVDGGGSFFVKLRKQEEPAAGDTVATGVKSELVWDDGGVTRVKPELDDEVKPPVLLEDVAMGEAAEEGGDVKLPMEVKPEASKGGVAVVEEAEVVIVNGDAKGGGGGEVKSVAAQEDEEMKE